MLAFVLIESIFVLIRQLEMEEIGDGNKQGILFYWRCFHVYLHWKDF